ncbi:MAG: DUF2628 domain-containing protein [Rickettsiales bacterium]|nr:DUF2628 domain-containing protein [Rickettsiales bacterium]
MKAYNILIKRDSSNKIEDLAVIKEGFSFTAFLFGVLWFLYHRMFKEVLILLLVVMLIQQIASFSSGFDDMLLELGLAVIIALNANFWLIQKLKRDGYEFVGMTKADDIEKARMEVVNDFDKKVFSDKFLDPRLDKKPHILKKIYSYINKLR